MAGNMSRGESQGSSLLIGVAAVEGLTNGAKAGDMGAAWSAVASAGEEQPRIYSVNTMERWSLADAAAPGVAWRGRLARRGGEPWSLRLRWIPPPHGHLRARWFLNGVAHGVDGAAHHRRGEGKGGASSASRGRWWFLLDGIWEAEEEVSGWFLIDCGCWLSKRMEAFGLRGRAADGSAEQTSDLNPTTAKNWMMWLDESSGSNPGFDS